MPHATDIRPIATTLYFLPVKNRVPLKFGKETVTSVVVARVCMRVLDRAGHEAEGWGETPLSVTWVWPGTMSFEAREEALQAFCVILAEAWPSFDCMGHAIEVGHEFDSTLLPQLLATFNKGRSAGEAMPRLAALVCCSPFDIALHDAYGHLAGLPVYATYGPEHMNYDLSSRLVPAADSRISFKGQYPCDILVRKSPHELPVWHLVGGMDPIDASDLTGTEPDDGYPVLLRDWILRDGLQCLKIKLRGNDSSWDYDRMLRIGQLAEELHVSWLTADFNCTVTAVDYVNDILDRLRHDHPRIYGSLLYVEQPFPYDLESNRIDVHSVSARKPLFMDESAHDWKIVRLGRELGWTGVALKTCKTQTGAILAACWAKAHGMSVMVQDLTNPMLAMIPHVQLAAHVGTIMGVECNSMQFYPEASLPEAEIHPGLYRRRHGRLDLSSIQGNGFGYQLDKIRRTLPPPSAAFP